MEHSSFFFPVAAALSGCLLVWLALTLRAAWLNARPETGSQFSRFGENIRVRDLFRLAVLLEEEGAALYLKLAERARNPGAKTLCLELAGQELAHKRVFESRLNGWRPLPVHLTAWPVFLERVKQEGLFGGAPGNQATEDALAGFAIRQEARTAEFYLSFEKSFPEAWRRLNIHALALEERAHEARLRAAYPHLK